MLFFVLSVLAAWLVTVHVYLRPTAPITFANQTNIASAIAQREAPVQELICVPGLAPNLGVRGNALEIWRT